MRGPLVWPAPSGLQGLVESCYSLRTRRSGGPVLPDARAGLVWLSDGTVRVCGPQIKPWAPDRAGVDVVGIRLSMGAVPAALGVPAHVLTDRRVHLHELWGPAAAGLAEKVANARDPYARAMVLQDAVLARGADTSQMDPVAQHLARRWAVASPGVRDLAGEVGLSERQLRRRCEAAFGFSPSFLRRVLRLHRFLAAARTAGTGARLADLAVASGYADQAHLARETRALTGHQPSQCLPARMASDPSKTTQGCGL